MYSRLCRDLVREVLYKNVYLSVLFIHRIRGRDKLKKNEAMFGYLHSSHKIFLIVTVHRTQVKSLNVSQNDGRLKELHILAETLG